MAPATLAPPPSFWALVGLFVRVGGLAFGGAVTIHLQQALIRRGWIDDAAYLEALNWCQNLPGPNATNLAVYLGYRYHGVKGALACTLAIVAPGAIAVLGLSWLLAGVPQQQMVTGALATVAAAAVGLLLGAIWQVSQPAGLRSPRAPGGWVRIAGAFVTFGAVALFHVPTPLAIAALVALLWRVPTAEGPP